MARLNQFYKGEDIKITINYDADAGFVEPAEGQLNFCLLVYPDTLDLTIETNRNDKIARIERSNNAQSADTPYWVQVREQSEDIGITFVIPYGKTMTLDSGDYTIELVYGDDISRKILRQNRSFTLVDSAGEYVESIVPTQSEP